MGPKGRQMGEGTGKEGPGSIKCRVSWCLVKKRNWGGPDLTSKSFCGLSILGSPK